ncbi:MAG TPA: hypothetical protein VEV19_08565 [Ktedonobacteraceae bacterium]|nr:hypothetical protein [Ktedonobacteraceae bacterium]
MGMPGNPGKDQFLRGANFAVDPSQNHLSLVSVLHFDPKRSTYPHIEFNERNR